MDFRIIKKNYFFIHAQFLFSASIHIWKINDFAKCCHPH